MVFYSQSAPSHIHTQESVQSLYWKTLAALGPALAAAAFFHGGDALRIMGLSLLGGGAAYALAGRIFDRKIEFPEPSLFLSCLLFALNMSPAASWQSVLAGSAFGIFFGREIFGGLAGSIFHPALAGNVFAGLAFSQALPADGVLAGGFAGAVCLFAGGIALVWNRLISLEIAALYLVFTFLLHFPGTDSISRAATGPVFLTAFFFVSDPVTTPLSRSGQRLFACGAALLGFIVKAPANPGVVLLMNGLSGWLDTWTKKRSGLCREPP